MVKKLSHIILSGALLLGTAGFVVNKHYSNGKLYSSSLYGEAKSCCDDHAMCSCCSTETEFFQVEDDFLSTTFQFPAIVCLQFFYDPLDDISELLVTSFTLSAPYPYLSHVPPEVGDFLSFIQVYII